MIKFPEKKPLVSFEYNLRSRYSETDKMGFVYHSTFLEYFEVARVEMIRSYGVNYKAMEDAGIMLPVKDAKMEFRQPVYYDEPITIRVMVYEQPSIRLRTFYKVIATERDVVCVLGEVTLFFMSEKERKPMRAPKDFLHQFELAIQENAEA